MKLFFWPLLLLGVPVFSQTNIPAKGITTYQSETERWNLNKYLWSHTQYKTGKNDKPVIDFDAMDNWLTLGGSNPVTGPGLSISPDGLYFAYTIDRGDNRQGYTNIDSLVVQSTRNTWRRSLFKIRPGFFSAGSKQYIYQKDGTLYFMALDGGETDSIKEVESYKTSADKEWIAMAIDHMGTHVRLQNLRTKKEKEFIDVKTFNFDNSGQWFYYETFEESTTFPKFFCIYNLKTGKEKIFLFDSYLFDEKGQVLVKKLTSPFIFDNQKEACIEYINLRDFSVRTIWSSTDPTIKINSYTLDKSGKQVVINLSKSDQNSIWYWKEGMDSAVLKVNEQTEGIDDNLLIQGTASFTESGNYIKFSLKPKADLRQQMPDAVRVDVWSYRDTILQSAQPDLVKRTASYTTVFNLENNHVVRLETETEKLYNWLIKGDFAVIQKAGKDLYGHRYWKKGYNEGINWLVSLKDGTRHLLATKAGKNYPYSIWFSPGGRYLVYFDSENGHHYFSYDLLSGKLADIATGIPGSQLCYVDPYMNTSNFLSAATGIAAWLEKDQGLLVYDNYDVWQLDLSGERTALNLTRGYGSVHKIVFTLANCVRPFPDALTIPSNEPLLLKAFNNQTKFSGYYRTKLGKSADPEQLYMAPCYMEGMQPLRAANENAWIIKKQTATEAPNYYFTTDFKSYTQLTNLQPQKNYNWLTADLVSFKQLDGTISQGVLYKPENFDATKKYPVIITFYVGGLSNLLYRYQTPEYINSPIIDDRVSWMVSHGYLVFLPDIYFTKGQWGPSTVNTVEGAAKYLGRLSYVDGKHIGAVGHSNSGRFGYYLLTHSHSFAAMSIGSGTTNIISSGLNLDGGGESLLRWAEVGSMGTGLGNLWQNKNSWLDQTSVLSADKANCPVLMYACKDRDVPVSEAVEMFTSLWRLEKKAWWLQYDDGGHVLGVLRDVRDFTIRYTQFFDHYLKGAPPPKWMCEGLPYKLKGKESRYELNSRGNCGENCPECKALHASNN